MKKTVLREYLKARENKPEVKEVKKKAKKVKEGK
jgi:hypothetical protein